MIAHIYFAIGNVFFTSLWKSRVLALNVQGLNTIQRDMATHYVTFVTAI